MWFKLTKKWKSLLKVRNQRGLKKVKEKIIEGIRLNLINKRMLDRELRSLRDFR